MWLYGPRKVLQAWKSIGLMLICRKPCMCRATWRKVLPYSPNSCSTELCSYALGAKHMGSQDQRIVATHTPHLSLVYFCQDCMDCLCSVTWHLSPQG